MNLRRGFSLIELVLAISLSIALVALLGLAIDLHLVRLDSSRTTIEQAQLARAILDRITTDLRGVTTAPPQDVSEQLAAAESAAKFNVDEVDQTTETDESAEAVASETETAPGLYGTIDTVTIDTRQLWQSLVTAEAGQPPVTRVGAGWIQITYGMSLVAETPGLVRSETPRDAARWRTEQGQTAPVIEPIAAEVRGVQFRYFDGDQLLEVWDMADQETLPTAVEVRIELAPADAADATNSNAERQATKIYRRVVRLPAAADENEEDAAATATDTEAV
ncbi:hypothetical protein Pla108_27250 [Botrimarina colliarenosi]|uniref:Type II secretion system protein J n=1 Tax=Botrimarina colliarenosi TaxID=2528001 RepID=A0A5C6AC97_9BACT|nr:type II secretion system protein GspJ [Botrimarina colliarenosi]TWT96948.1 hypothetical protein Pla108_27250 [Botrimarina colliarenosi]